MKLPLLCLLAFAASLCSHYVAGDMPTKADVATASAGDEEHEIDVLKKVNGVYKKVVDGKVTDEGLGEDKEHHMQWRDDVVRSFNRSFVNGEHPGKAYAQSIRVFDVHHAQKLVMLDALREFYKK